MNRFYSSFVASGDLVFDVGANVGHRTSVFRKLGATVIAVEPQQQCADALRRRFGTDSRVRIVQKGLGREEGECDLFVSSESTLTSMSKDWMQATQRAGRFEGIDLAERPVERISVTTLDQLIAEFGTPRFCKIDVEGFEEEVVAGLSQPVESVSFEFTAEFIDAARNTVRHLASIGMTQFNFSPAETLEFDSPSWLDESAILELLAGLSWPLPWGDVYARRA